MKALALIALTLVACVPQRPQSGVPSSKCSTVRLVKFIGQPATVALASQALKRARATVARAIGPGEVVTMDYRVDRLNIHLDANNRVGRFTCG